ncbi:hypothetical protein DAEQUDRAFT_760264 [Daedalea quercina L-15889]|uniref:Uncharacterized protein n=1 Tax=Daedalea quercina L-15889 TaxID=1314783 RepID=A0A165L1B3_9APHY|nr:hypothetical protein DAEQUDRAFT_760264 [Daedalea quercina L-15889]
MLLYPLLLKGAAALRAMFILAVSASTSRCSHYLSRPALGATLAFTVGFSLRYSLSSILVSDDESPLLELVRLLQPPPIVDPVFDLNANTSESVTVEVEPNFSDVPVLVIEPGTTSTADPYTPADTPLDTPGPLKLDSVAPSLVFVDVPELDWATPGAPTIRAPKVAKSDVIYYDFFFFGIFRGPRNSTFWNRADQPAPPAVPDDDVRSVPRYEAPELTFDRYVRKKGVVPDMGEFTVCLIMAMRFVVLLLTLWVMLGEPGELVDALVVPCASIVLCATGDGNG